MKALTLIIFKHHVNPKFPPALAKTYKDSFNCGWLSNNLNEPYILQWGNSKNIEAAKSLMQDVLSKQGERTVLFYNKEISLEKEKCGIIRLTKEVYADIVAGAEKWN